MPDEFRRHAIYLYWAWEISEQFWQARFSDGQSTFAHVRTTCW